MLLEGRGDWSWDAGASNTWRHSSPNQAHGSCQSPGCTQGLPDPRRWLRCIPHHQHPPAPLEPVSPRIEDSQGSQAELPHDVSIRAVHRPIYIRTSRLEPSIISL